jgi:hypothetical protein
MDPGAFNRQVGLPDNMLTGLATGMLVDPMTIAGVGAATLGTRTGRKLLRSAGRKLRSPGKTTVRLLEDEAGTLGGRGKRSIKGEFWLDDTGYPTFADGDLGDMNHEAVAMDHLRREIIERHPTLSHYAGDEYPDWEGFLREASGDNEYLRGVTNNVSMRHIRKLNEKGMADSEKIRQLDDLLQSLGVDDDTMDVAQGVGDTDARLYAAKNWGWTRMDGNNLETHGLSQGKLKKLADGVSSAASDREDIYDELFDIYDFESRKFYQDVPFDVLEAGDVKALRDYTTKFNRPKSGTRTARWSKAAYPKDMKRTLMFDENAERGYDWLAQHYKDKMVGSPGQVMGAESPAGMTGKLQLWEDQPKGELQLLRLLNREIPMYIEDVPLGSPHAEDWGWYQNYAHKAPGGVIGLNRREAMRRAGSSAEAIADVAQGTAAHEAGHALTYGNIDKGLEKWLQDQALQLKAWGGGPQANRMASANRAAYFLKSQRGDMSSNLIDNLLEKLRGQVDTHRWNYLTEPDEILTRVMETRRMLEQSPLAREVMDAAAVRGSTKAPDDVSAASLIFDPNNSKHVSELLSTGELPHPGRVRPLAEGLLGARDRDRVASLLDLLEYFGPDKVKKLLRVIPALGGAAGGGALLQALQQADSQA